MSDILRLARLAEAADIAHEAARRPGPSEPRRAALEVNGSPVRIKGTPYYLRVSSASNFQAEVSVEIFVNERGKALRVELIATVETWAETTENAFVGLLADDGSTGVSWTVFQEARRGEGRTNWKIGRAMFRFDIFTVTHI